MLPFKIIEWQKMWESPVGNEKVFFVREDGKKRRITYPQSSERSPEQDEFFRWMNRTKPEDVYKSIKSRYRLAGGTIYMDLAHLEGADEAFVYWSDLVIRRGGGLIIYLDQQDDLSDNCSGRDRGYHYATVGIDLGGDQPEELRQQLWTDGQYSQIIPLPMLVERFGYVAVDDDDMPGPEEFSQMSLSEKRDLQRHLTLSFSQVVDLLMKLTNGHVRLGFREEWDPLLHFHRSRETHLPADERVQKLHDLYRGPLVPKGASDEERETMLRDWLLKQKQFEPGVLLRVLCPWEK